MADSEINTYAYNLVVTSVFPAKALFLTDGGCIDISAGTGFLLAGRELFDCSPTTDDREDVLYML